MAQRKRKTTPQATKVSQEAPQATETLPATTPSNEPENATQANTEPTTPATEDTDEDVDTLQLLPAGRVMNAAQYQDIKDQGLPPHLTLWELEDSPYTENRKIIVFYNGEKPVTHMEISADTTEDLLTALNQEVAYQAPESADSWFIKTPDSPKATPYLHFTSNGAIVDSLPLTKPFMKEIMPQLLKVYNPIEENKQKGLIPWATRHRIKSGLLIALLSAMFIYGTYTYFF